MELHQKSLLEKRSFFLLPNQLKLYLKDAEGEYVNYIGYESLRGNTQVRSHKNSKLLFMSMITVTFALCVLCHILLTSQSWTYMIFPLTFASVFVMLYLTQQQKYVVIETFERHKVVFLQNEPNRQALENFLDQLWAQRRQYLRKKYFYISQDYASQRQADRLRWLLEQHAISQSEFKFAAEDWIIDKSQQFKCRDLN